MPDNENIGQVSQNKANESNDEAMERLIKEQAINQSELERFIKNYKKSPKDRLKSGYIKERKFTLQEQWKRIEQLQRDILRIYSDKYKTLRYFSEDVYSEMEETYFQVCGLMNEQLEAITAIREPPKTPTTPVPISMQVPNLSTAVSKNEHSDVKLPRINIPKFAGNYSQWPSFHDLFEAIVHKNTQISNVQKLHYLRTCLSGEAETLIKHLQLTEANYIPAWELLQKRYQNNRMLVATQLTNLTSMPCQTVENAQTLRRMLDKVNEILEALKGLKIQISNWDPLLIHILVQKLTKETLTHWETRLSNRTDPNALPTMEEFKEFLEKRFRALESIGGTKHINKNESRNDATRVHISQNKEFATKGNFNCPVCNKNHILRDCIRFNKMSANERYQFIKKQSRCFNCFGKSHTTASCPKPYCCQKCKKRHNTLLHFESPTNQIVNPSSNSVKSNVSIPQEPNNVSMNRINNASVNTDSHQIQNLVVERTTTKTILLATALINIYTENNEIVTLRALLDQGSQASFITERGAQLLKNKRKPTYIIVTGIGSTEAEPTRSEINIRFGPHFTTESKFLVSALVIKKITGITPSNTIQTLPYNHLKGLQLADPQCFKPGHIDVLLGADIYSELIQDGVKKGTEGTPLAQKTALGWILSGPIEQQTPSATASLVCEISTTELLRKFWEVEGIQEAKFFTKEEELCEKIYDTHHQRINGRYIVQLPFKTHPNPPSLGNSRSIAIKRQLSLERKLNANPNLKKEYSNFMREYQSLGHMREIQNKDESFFEPNYLPHHCVVKEDSTTTKVRVVFDASAKTTNGLSLNDCLLAGPTIQEELTTILLRWRTHKIAFTADIEKMYRQIQIAEEDTDYQRILWRENSNEPMKEYRLLTVTYGTSCAPYLAVRTMQQLAIDEGNQFKRAAEIVLRDFYVDDLISGADNIEEAVFLQDQLMKLLAKGGFNLRKWSSNNENVIANIPEESREIKKNITELNLNTTIKTLGVHWNTSEDSFKFKIKVHFLRPKTKRELLSAIARLFDPLGWLAPTVVVAKIMMQQLWLLGSNWDDELPLNLATQWSKFHDELKKLEEISIPRWLKTSASCEYEIHGFCDASVQAYGAVIYLRAKHNQTPVISLVTAKTRVAPIRQLSLPKLELCAASLLAKLLCQLKAAISFSPNNTYLWTDSTIVLYWLQAHPSKWKTFVANRTSDIQEKTRGCCWRYVPTADNPADCASRGLTASKLKEHTLWWNGPNWLLKEKNEWPSPINVPETKLELKRSKVLVNSVISHYESKAELLHKFSSWNKLQRIVALCKRFANNCRNSMEKIFGYVTIKELRDAKKCIIRITQEIHFFEEIRALNTHQPLPKGCKIQSLNPFVDTDKILRVGGRLRHSHLSYDEKHPMILSPKCFVTRLIIDEVHKRTLHGGPQLLLATMRKEFWIVNGKNIIRQHIHKCIICWKQKAATQQQLMADLPEHRISQSRAFQHVGIDFCGPIMIKSAKGRGRIKTMKGYICIFICLATKAIHLEVVSELTADAFIAAFRRFTSRRGTSSHIYSDCGTNFIGASRKLNKINLQKEWNIDDKVYSSLEEQGCQWHFIPPGSPHFGGLWESGVKSTKYHMKRVMGTTLLTFEELTTLITQIEASLNSRPLCPISNDPDDFTALTPGHFLIGNALLSPPEEDLFDFNANKLTRWTHIQQMHQRFWRQWHSEYLHRLQQRPKWLKQQPNIKKGDLVLVKDERLPPTRWLLGRIIEVHPGSDGIVRVVTIKTKTTTLKRAISKVCLLPIEDNTANIH